MRILAIFWVVLLFGCSGGCAGAGSETGAAIEHGGGESSHAASGGDAAATGGETRPRIAGPLAPAHLARPGQWLGAAPLSHTMLRGGDGATHLGVWVDVPRDAAGDVPRPPLAISLVIDASGSMAGEKIRHARMAASRLVDSLSDGDVVGLYTFADRVQEIALPTTVGPDSRRHLLRMISEVRSGGSTALHAGVATGQRELRRVSTQSHPIRRVLVISDGLANVGPSRPEDFAHLARQGAHEGIQVSAIGVGLDYSEHTLGALALNSEGRMYHLEHSEQLASILDSELNLLSQTVALNAVVELSPSAGVTLEGLEVGRAEHVGRRLRIPLGALYAGQERELLVRARVSTEAGDIRELASVRLTYDLADRSRSADQQVVLRYGVSDDTGAVEASYDSRVESLLASHRAAEKQERAAEMLNRGESQQAALVLEEAEADLQIAVQKAPALKKGRLREARRKVGRRKVKAAAARTRAESRGQALEAYDDAMGLRGY